MPLINNLDTLPDDLPVPVDDGAARHLEGLAIPAIPLPATDGTMVVLSDMGGRSVVYLYPRTGQPGRPALAENWNDIPGARGCTPQTAGYRDLASSFQQLGYRIFGLSTQTRDYQQEMIARLKVPFLVLSDAELRLTRAMSLPTFIVSGEELLKRMTWIVENGRILKVFYPVFPPDGNAAELLAWIGSHPSG